MDADAVTAAPFTWSFRIRYHETDPQKFAFNSRYLEYSDVAMTEYFRHLGWSYPEMLAQGFDPSLVATSIEFKRPATLDDAVSIQVICPHVGSASFTLDFALLRSGELLCTIQSTYVNVDAAKQRATPIPPAIAAKLRTVQSSIEPKETRPA